MNRGKLALLCLGLTLASASPAEPALSPLAERVMTLTRATRWLPAGAIRLRFRTFHPQGMVRIGGNFFVSSVEVRTPPRKLPAPRDGYDRDTGAGIAHLFKIGPDGALLADLVLGEGAIYHPGGIDFDGTSIWVPVSEYRPDSRAIVYTVDPDTMKATEVFRFADHLGGIIHDIEDGTLHGVSWAARRFYTWSLGATGKPGEAIRTPDPVQYIDYQDCHYAGGHRMLCAGVGDYPPVTGKVPFQLGGIDLIDLADHRPLWQVPVVLRSPTGRSMTQNPFWAEAAGAGLRVWFMPDDDRSTIFAFDTAAP